MSKLDIFEYLKAIPDIPKSEWGKTFIVECPCGGKLYVARETSIGHLRAKCDKCGFSLIE